VVLAGCGGQPVVQPPAKDGLPTVGVGQLPVEAQTTLMLIDKGGPFPYQQDGVVFQNRERLLPAQARGYYHEYTVPTPGSRDRGARRIITGEQAERYYTDDHYRSFRRIVS
jgi:ribonuclease T1